MAQSELVQKSIEVASNPGNQGAVGVVTFITGWSTCFALITPIIGAIAGILGGALTVLLFINAYKKGRDDRKMRRLEREEKHLKIEALKKEAEGS